MGENRAFYKMKSLVYVVAGEGELSITKVGSDFEWREALRVFHSQ